MKLSLPKVSLEKLYRYYISKGAGFSKKALKDYSKAAEVLLVGLEEKLSPEEFKARIASRILNELGVRKALSILSEKGLPIDSQSFMQALSKIGVETNKTTVETLLSLLKKTGVLWFLKTFRLKGLSRLSPYRKIRLRMAEPFLERIEVDVDKLGGKPVIKGTRIPVALILELVANGKRPEEIIKEYPELSPEDIKAALLYAARLAEKEIVLALE
jgi:uncharacterized protein (DUF433 family)